MISQLAKGEPSIDTSLIEVTDKLPNKPPCRIFIKNQYEQPSGSFKLRGMGHLVAKSIERAHELKKENVETFASSGGNAGLAAAYTSRHYNSSCSRCFYQLQLTVGLLKSWKNWVLKYKSMVPIGVKPTHT